MIVKIITDNTDIKNIFKEITGMGIKKGITKLVKRHF